MPELNQTGNVFGLTGDRVDRWKLKLGSGTFPYVAVNTGKHGKFRFVIKAEHEELKTHGLKTTWQTRVEETLDAGETKKNSFLLRTNWNAYESYDTGHVKVTVKWLAASGTWRAFYHIIIKSKKLPIATSKKLPKAQSK